MTSSRVSYVTSGEARRAADSLPTNKGRASLVHSLIHSLDLLDDRACDSTASTEASPPKAKLVAPAEASREDLLRFHSKDFIDAMWTASREASVSVSSDSDAEADTSSGSAQPPTKRRCTKLARTAARGQDEGASDEDASSVSCEEDEYGLDHDCPAFAGLTDYALWVAGGSMTAARELRDGLADIAIYWDGGRHHATKSKASGFCYVNDIVLAIMTMQQKPPSNAFLPQQSKRLSRILYIDLDLHHGDGVAEAFRNNKRVCTVSCHLWSPGFYPSLPHGRLEYTGPNSPSPAAYTTLNLAIPKSGLSSSSHLRVIRNCIKPVYDTHAPDAVVVQCGVDGMAGDPCREWNLDLQGYGRVLQDIMRWTGHPTSHQPGVSASGNDGSGHRPAADSQETLERGSADKTPLLLLGGGGYNSANAARAWAYLTSVGLGRPLRLGAEGAAGTSSPEAHSDGTPIPESCEDWDAFGPSFMLDVRASGRQDENTEADLERIEAAFTHYVDQLKRKPG